jgi:hypothetical protein
MPQLSAYCFAAALAALPLSHALAAGTLKPDGTNHTAAFSGSPQVQHWRAFLHAGHDFRVEADSGWCVAVTVRGPGGKVLGSLSEGSEIVFGLEFTAPRDGWYDLAVTGRRCDPAMPPGGLYDLALWHDCRGDTRTSCAPRFGTVWAGMINYDERGDDDWYRVQLVAGHAYTFAELNGGLGVDLWDSAGGSLATSAPGQPLAFTAPATGTYFVAVGATSEDSAYRLAFAQ